MKLRRRKDGIDIKVYKETAILVNQFYDMFNDELNSKIREYQQKGYQVEVHYSTNSERKYETFYSALILAYTEESNA